MSADESSSVTEKKSFEAAPLAEAQLKLRSLTLERLKALRNRIRTSLARQPNQYPAWLQDKPPGRVSMSDVIDLLIFRDDEKAARTRAANRRRRKRDN